MPRKYLSPCAEPGCPKLCRTPYCPVHTQQKPRGSHLNDRAAYGAFKREVLARGFCQRCGRTPGRDGIRLTAHHRDPLSKIGSHQASNGLCLCDDCHEMVDPYYHRPPRSRK